MPEEQRANIVQATMPHDIAEFKGPFKPGFDPRRHIGAPALGREITAYWNQLGAENEDGTAKYPVAALKKIVKDKNSPHAKVMAAEDMLRARSKGYDIQGRIPKAANSMERILDRTVGKPVQSVVVAQVDTRDPNQLKAELLAMIEQRPELRKFLESLGASHVLPEAFAESVEADLDKSRLSTPTL